MILYDILNYKLVLKHFWEFFIFFSENQQLIDSENYLN